MLFRQSFESFCSARRKVGSFPNFVQTAGVARITAQQFLARNTQPTRDPNIDRIRLGERAAHHNCWRRIEEHHGQRTLRG